jgi:uncharacterized protein (TIGR03437 family)
VAALMGAFAIVLWAYEYGPNPGVCGVPREAGTCAQSGCHTGTTNNAANRGSLAIGFPNGLTYTPGVKQTLTVTISDPAPTQQAWGFEVTARTTDPATMAGTFTPDDAYTQIMCSQANLQVFNTYCLPGANGNGSDSGCRFPSKAPVCPANLPLQYMEHSVAGYSHTLGLVQGSGTYQFDWTPPATNVGNITFYIAGNAGVGGPPNQNGDHIYATTFTLSPPGNGVPPTLSAVQNGASFLPGFSQGSWITITGTNLAATTRIWTADDFVGPNLPTQLDGASVTVDGMQAYIYYISPTQINALAPADAALGSVPVQAAFGGLTSNIVSSTEAAFSPAMFMFGPLGQKYVAAVRSDGQYIGPANLYPGLTVPAKANDIILLYGTGFGPTSPTTSFGETFSGAPPTTNTVTCTIGGAPASVLFAGLVAPGEYQLNITVPSGLPAGDNLVVLKVGGVSTQANAYLTVQ